MRWALPDISVETIFVHGNLLLSRRHCQVRKWLQTPLLLHEARLMLRALTCINRMFDLELP